MPTFAGLEQRCRLSESTRKPGNKDSKRFRELGNTSPHGDGLYSGILQLTRLNFSLLTFLRNFSLMPIFSFMTLHYQSFCSFITFTASANSLRCISSHLQPLCLLIAHFWFFFLSLFNFREKNFIALPDQHYPFLDKAVGSNCLINLWMTYIFAGVPSLALGDDGLYKMRYKMLKDHGALPSLTGGCERAGNVACFVQMPEDSVDVGVRLPFLKRHHSEPCIHSQNGLVPCRQVKNCAAPADPPPPKIPDPC